ncbi:hypothetical protein EYF80_009840 [Liparis tanakae]|uniref:Uncharacterized protein n=1 Tax=Liparis tanakae TaxID=230148 RepID=A0A4Z2IRI5_9TELE|nr:hypothetical protein EYF80_009840 [Liparis tanakae]
MRVQQPSPPDNKYCSTEPINTVIAELDSSQGVRPSAADFLGYLHGCRADALTSSRQELSSRNRL